MAISLLKEMPVDIPPLHIQRRIADVMSAYDELIENSQEGIRVLEAMARAIYREWFVCGNLPIAKSTFTIQERTLGDLCRSTKEAFSEQIHGDLPLLELSRIPQHSIAPADTGHASQLTTSRIVFAPGDTLFGAIRCYLHKVVSAHCAGVTNTSVLVLE